VSIAKTSRLRLYNEIGVICDINYTAHVRTLCGGDAGDLGLQMAVRVLITRL
jgi:hypothetical protein